MLRLAHRPALPPPAGRARRRPTSARIPGARHRRAARNSSRSPHASVWWRGGAVRYPRVSRLNRSPSRARTSPGANARIRAAASSIASGKAVEASADLGHRRHRLLIRLETRGDRPGAGHEQLARLRRWPAAEAATATPRDRQALPAGGQDLQVRAPGQQVIRRAAAAPAMTCSQLSRTSSAWRRARNSPSRCKHAATAPVGRNVQGRRGGAGHAGVVARPGRARRATLRRGSGRVGCAPTSIASRVFPDPPTPAMVTSLLACSS